MNTLLKPMRVGLLIILCVIAVLPLLLPDSIVQSEGSNFVTRSGTQLMLNGQPFCFSGPNIVWLGLDEVAGQDAGFQTPDYPSQFRVNDALDTVVAMGGTVVRSHTLGHSFGCATDAGIQNGPGFHGRCLEPALGVFNEEAFRHVDYAIYAAGQRGLKLILPLVDEYQYFHGGRHTFTTWRGVPASDFWTNPVVINDFKQYLNKIINRVNIYTNVRYKDDPTIMAWETGNELNAQTSWTQEIAHFIRTQDTNHLIIDGTYGINENALLIPYIDIYSDHFYPLNIAKLNRDLAKTVSANKVFYAGEFPWQNDPGGSSGDDLDSFLTALENSTAAGSSYWTLFPHRGDYHYMQHSDGPTVSYTLHWPGDDATMRDAALRLRSHAYTMSGLPVPPHAVPTAPLITNISGSTVFWRGAVGGDLYSIESSTNGTDWTVVCDKCVTDNPGYWTDPTTYTGSVWYRIRAWNLDDAAGAYSPVQQKGAALPAATATYWPTLAASPTPQSATQTFTPSPLAPTATSTPVGAGTFYKGININGGAVTIEGNQWLSYAEAQADGFSVGSSAIPDTKNLTPTPAADADTSAMLNSLVYSFTDLDFAQTVPSGTYQVYLWTMENFQSNIRSWNVMLEGATVGRNLGDLVMNQWAKYGPFQTTVTDGTLNIDLVHVNANPMVMGIALYQVNVLPTATLTPSITPGGPTFTPTRTPSHTRTPVPPSSTPTSTNTPEPTGIFYKGINFNGNAVTIEGNLWTSYWDALGQGLSVTGAGTGTASGAPYTPIPATDSQTASMLDTLLWASSGTPINIAQSLPNGTYQIYIYEVEGYADYVRSMNVRLEGITAATGVGHLPLYHWAKYGPYNVTVTDGVLNLDLMPISAGAQISGLSIFQTSTLPTSTPAPTNTATPTSIPGSSVFFKGINFNGNAVTIEGNNWTSYWDALGQGLSVTNAGTGTASGSPYTPVPATDSQTASMLNTLLWASSGTTINIAQVIPNGNYQIYVYEIEGYADHVRSMNLKLEGIQVASGIGDLSLYHWAKYGPYDVTVMDGVLNVDLVPVAAGAQISGLSIFKTSSLPTSTPSPTSVPNSATFHKGINFNGEAVTIEGNAWTSYWDALGQGLSVTNAGTGTASGAPYTPVPATDSQTASMLNTLLWASSGTTINIAQVVPNGNYQIYVYEIEGYADHVRSMNLKLEGAQVASGIGDLALYHWAKYGPYDVAVTDGVLNVDLVPVSAGAQISGLSIFRLNTEPTSTATFTPTSIPTNTPEIPTNTPAPTSTVVVPTNTAVPPTPLPTNAPGKIRPKLKLSALCSPAPNLYRVWRVQNKANKPVSFTWTLLRSQQYGTGFVGANQSMIFQTITVPNKPNVVVIWANNELHDIALSAAAKCP